MREAFSRVLEFGPYVLIICLYILCFFYSFVKDKDDKSSFANKIFDNLGMALLFLIQLIFLLATAFIFIGLLWAGISLLFHWISSKLT